MLLSVFIFILKLLSNCDNILGTVGSRLVIIIVAMPCYDILKAMVGGRLVFVLFVDRP